MYKYLIIAITIGLLAYFSIDIKALDEVKKDSAEQFDAKKYARNFLDQTLIPGLDKAVALDELIQALQSNPKQAFEQHSHAVSIGNLRYFLVKGEGQISSVEENTLQIQLAGASAPPKLNLATEFIYGNAIRDAAGLFDLKAFPNTGDANNIAAELNRIIREEVLPPFRKQVVAGDRLRFTGAIELNQAHLNLQQLEIFPISLQKL